MGKHNQRFPWKNAAHNVLLAATVAGVAWWGFASWQIGAEGEPTAVVAAVNAPTTTTPPEPTPHAMPTTDKQVVDAHSLGFLTALIRDGVDVSQHEYHIVMTAESMCNRDEPDWWRPAPAGEREGVALKLYPHWTKTQAAAFVNATHFYCHALKGAR